jgi:hypothetical protein
VTLLEVPQRRQARQAPLATGEARRGLVAFAWAVLLVTAVSAAAWAQDAQEELRKTCRADYAAHCTGSDPPFDIMVACLNQYYVGLTRGCQDALRNLPSAQSGSASGGRVGGRGGAAPEAR